MAGRAAQALNALACSAAECSTGGTRANRSGDRNCVSVERKLKMLLDTNAISAWSKDDAGLWKAMRADRSWYLPSIALGEYRYGVLKSLHRGELEHWLDAVEKSCVVLSAD